MRPIEFPSCIELSRGRGCKSSARRGIIRITSAAANIIERERERDKCSCKNGAFFFIRSIETDIRSRSSRKEERKGEERRKIGRRRPCDNKNFDVK